jgi:hypothetical protein
VNTTSDSTGEGVAAAIGETTIAITMTINVTIFIVQQSPA